MMHLIFLESGTYKDIIPEGHTFLSFEGCRFCLRTSFSQKQNKFNDWKVFRKL